MEDNLQLETISNGRQSTLMGFFFDGRQSLRKNKILLKKPLFEGDFFAGRQPSRKLH